MLSIVGSGPRDAYSTIARLVRDRAESTAALVKALGKNPAGGVRVLTGSDLASDPGSLGYVVWGLSRTESASSTEALRSLLARSERYLPVIIRTLRLRRDAESVPLFIRHLGSANEVVCGAAARALGEMRVRDALPPLRRELGRTDTFTKRDIVEAIVLIEGDQAAQGLFRRAGSWGTVAQHYLLYPLVRSGGGGENVVLSRFESLLPDRDNSLSAARALVDSDRPSALLGLVNILAKRKDLSGLGAFRLKSNLILTLVEGIQVPEAIEPLAVLASNDDACIYVAEGLERRPGPQADRIVMEALRRGAAPSGFREYLRRRPLPDAIPFVKAAHVGGGMKSWDLEMLIRTGAAGNRRPYRDPFHFGCPTTGGPRQSQDCRDHSGRICRADGAVEAPADPTV